MKSEPAILFLTKYGRLGPSSRYRVLQYLPGLRARGFRCDVQSLHDDSYLEAIFSGRRPSPLYHARRLRARWRAVASAAGYDVVFVQKELAPFVPPVLERRLAASGVPVVYDIDDAIFLRYERSRNPLVRGLLGGKIAGAVSGAAAVLAGNDWLAAWARGRNPRTVPFPTVIEPAKYEEARRTVRGAATPGQTVPVVVWIGTPETFRFVDECREALREAGRSHRFLFRVIGAPEIAGEHAGAEGVPWSEDTEAEELARADIGIMPLPVSDWTRGKCGLKLLQYMASSLPVIASPTGGAEAIVRDGETGFLARNAREWLDRLVTLVERADLRREMGERGLRRVKESYSLERWAPRMADILARVARREGVEGASS